MTIQLDDDFNSACCKNGKYGKIQAITATVNGEVKNVKYSYPDAFATLAAYGVSIKYMRLVYILIFLFF